MNWTVPGRLHVMIRRNYVWLTIWLFRRRYHFTTIN